MARITFTEKSGIKSLSGRAGNLVFRTGADGQTYAQQAPSAQKKAGTPAQQQWRRGTFREAVAYGNAQKRDPAGVAYYMPFRQAGKFSSVYSLALADYTQPPEVQSIEPAGYSGQAGWLLRVQAHDPYGVVRVQIQVLNGAQQVLEEGEAVLNEEWWEYATRQAYARGVAQQVRALAYDRPGNIARGEVLLEAEANN